MNADDALLASAYLDGELTDEERRIAEADPAVMAEVEQLRALRESLADVEPPSDAARERAIAAAMATFAELRAPAAAVASTHAPTTVPVGRRDPMRWLGVAAAVLVIGLLGVVLATGVGRGGDDDDSASNADEAAEEPATEQIAAAPLVEESDSDTNDGSDADDSGGDVGRLVEGEADDAESDPETADRAEVFAEEPAMESAGEEPADEPAEEPASEQADDAADDAPSDIASGDSPDATFPAVAAAEQYLDGRAMDSPAAVVVVARHLLDLIDRRELPPTPNHSCPFPDVLAGGFYDEPPFGDPVEVYINVDTVSREVLAIDTEACRVLLRVDLDD